MGITKRQRVYWIASDGFECPTKAAAELHEKALRIHDENAKRDTEVMHILYPEGVKLLAEPARGLGLGDMFDLFCDIDRVSEPPDFGNSDSFRDEAFILRDVLAYVGGKKPFDKLIALVNKWEKEDAK